ncbi:MAG: Ig-like domain-containing protein [Gammaproteobacteria bacterium]
MAPTRAELQPCDTEDLDYEECILFEKMILGLGTHNTGLVAGFLPGPFGIPGEVSAFAGNIALKSLPPWLFAPDDREVDPAAGDGVGYSADGCGIEFELLSQSAEYTNFIGYSIFEPYRDPPRVKFKPWRNPLDPDDTRFGFLRSPRLYHANTDVALQIQTPYQLRKWNQGSQTFGEPYTPIDPLATGPQLVHLPIGQHGIQWRAGSKKNKVTDVIVPAGSIAFMIASELKIGKNAYKLLKRIVKRKKSPGIGNEITEEVLTAAEVGQVTRAWQKYNDVWTKAFEDRRARNSAFSADDRTKFIKATNYSQELRKKLRKKIKKRTRKLLTKLFKKLKQQGWTAVAADIKDEISPSEGPGRASLVETTRQYFADRNPLGAQEIDIDVIIAELENDVEDSVVFGIIQRSIETCGPLCLLDLYTEETAVSAKGQIITVWDSVPPTIEIDPEPLIIPATDFGGTRLFRVREQLLEIGRAASTDNCGRTAEIILSAPELLKLGPQQVTLTARDRGPNPDDSQDYAPTAEVNIIVEDTEPPLLLAPPSKVIWGTADVTRDDANIGDAVANDIVDVQADVTNDAPDSFPLNRRTLVTWTAVDDSLNVAESTQLITIKESNTAPTANATAATTRTAEAVDITLTANDVDELDNQFDPLSFKIVSQPDHGEFVAPLYPFFIEDYRTKPNDGLGPNFPRYPLDTVKNYLDNTACNSNSPEFGEPPKDFVHNPLFVHVTDDGIRYVLDDYYVCLDFNEGAESRRRFSKWNAAGDYLGMLPIDNISNPMRGDAFRADRDGFLYYNTIQSAGTSSATLTLQQCPTNDWPYGPSGGIGCTGFPINGNSDIGLSGSSLAYARIDSVRKIIYVVDGRSIFALEPRGSWLGEVGPKDSNGEVLGDWFGAIPTLEIGSDGALYANDEAWDRIHKIGPATVDENGELVPGEYIGWAGKCTASGFGDCDIDPVNPEQGRSFGYSCTWENANLNDPVPVPTCTVAANAKSACNPEDPGDVKFDARAGCRQGQFDTPKYISIDPNDVLYVADYENARVQRLSPDGSFAGEAVSEDSGIDKASRPSFILGNLGQPESVAVNSSQFFVVDRRERFVYVFGTLPFKDVKESTVPGASMEATVTYVSDQAFPNPNVTGEDTFSFSVSDGLEQSDSATVTVTVNRNFRPPQAASIGISTSEDESVDFELPAGDPDGVIGKDPQGLDTLTYRLTRWPENGTLSGFADAWTYTPAPDFNGEDGLSFIVNDGVDDSNEATLTFTVTPRNDPPVVAAEIPDRVALGFETVVQAEFTDDLAEQDSGEYTAFIDWGDGSSDSTGELVDDGDEADLLGIVTVAPMNADDEGATFAKHSYEQTGERTINVCVTDTDGLEGCDEFDIEVELLVFLGVRGIFYDEPLEEDEVTLQEIPDGSDFTFEITVVNAEPSVGAGLTAEDIVIDLLLPADLAVDDITIGQGSCAREGLTVSCAIGTLSPGSETVLTMTVMAPGNLIYDEDHEFEGTVGTSSDALDQAPGIVAGLTLIADTTDTDEDGMSDTFENTFGFDPDVDDGAGDADRDGLSNADEYNEGSSPLTADTDGDGVSDGDEVVAGTDPTIDDIPPVLDIPTDITIDATGALTLVALGAATAIDFRDGVVEATANDPGPFRPGRHVVQWNASDESGNEAQGFQFVDVVPMVSLQVDQAVSEGTLARVSIELNGPAVTYPVTVPYQVSGTATNPGDHDGADGEAVIASGLSTEIEIDIVRDANDEPDETIVLSMGDPENAVPGATTVHTISVTELNLPPKVMIDVEQQGRPTTKIVSGAGPAALIANVDDDPAQQHSFDWSGSDSALIDPITVNDPAYLLEASGLSAGLYDMRVSVRDDGLPAANAEASSLLSVAAEPLLLKSSDDADADGESDAAEGPGDRDGDRIADYLDDIANSNLLRLAADGRLLETQTGLNLRLGSTAFQQDSVYASFEEQIIGTDIEYGYSSDLMDFEITRLDQNGSAQIVIPLASPIPNGAVYRISNNGLWQDFVQDADNRIGSAPGERGACPPAANETFGGKLTAADGCLQLTMTDGGPNDVDGLADGVIRLIGGLAVPISARGEAMPQTTTTLAGDGEVVMVRFLLSSDSGDTALNSLTLQAAGKADELLVDDVFLIYDADRDGEWDDADRVLANGRYTSDDETLTLFLDEPLEVPAGDTNLLVVYVFGEVELENDDE